MFQRGSPSPIYHCSPGAGLLTCRDASCRSRFSTSCSTPLGAVPKAWVRPGRSASKSVGAGAAAEPSGMSLGFTSAKGCRGSEELSGTKNDTIDSQDMCIGSCLGDCGRCLGSRKQSSSWRASPGSRPVVNTGLSFWQLCHTVVLLCCQAFS